MVSPTRVEMGAKEDEAIQAAMPSLIKHADLGKSGLTELFCSMIAKQPKDERIPIAEALLKSLR